MTEPNRTDPSGLLHLALGDLACDLRPALGGAIAGLRWRGQDVLRPTAPTAATARLASSYPLVPYSNRIAQAQLQWGGRRWALAPNNAPEPHAIHGTGWQDHWEVVAATSTSATLRLRHAADGRWPFDFEAEQAIALEPGALVLRMEVRNRSHGPMPAGLGWHPFFVKRPGARLDVPATGRWEMGTDKLPTRRLPHAGLGGPLDGVDVDHCFDGWDGQAVLEDARVRIRVTSDLSRIVVFTTPQRDVVAIEPVSHVNNVLGDPAIAGLGEAATGQRELAPGAALAAWMRIEVAPAAG